MSARATTLLLVCLACAAVPVVAGSLREAKDGPALMELTRTGELLVLPAHGRSPWRGSIVTQHPSTCAEVERTMMNVRDYPKIWTKMRNVRILETTPTKVRYSFELDWLLSPKYQTVIENPTPGTVIFTGNDTEGKAEWTLVEESDGCRVVYDGAHPKGSNSGFVKVLKRMEPGVVDAAELAGALTLARGYAPLAAKTGKGGRLSADAQRLLLRLARGATVVRILPRGSRRPVFLAYRVVKRPVDEVVAAISDYRSYGKTVDFLDEVSPQHNGARWEVDYFGGSVDFTTKTAVSGDAKEGAGLIIKEKVVGGDLDDGYWAWRIREMSGGAFVELELDLDITEGSTVLKTLTKQDDMIRDSTSLQVVFEFMRTRVVGD